MILAQGFRIGERNELILPEDRPLASRIPTGLLPVCPNCGRPLTTNLRADDKFVEDEGWHAAADAYEKWVTAHQAKRVVYLEIGVGYNTPGIIKFNFWQQTYRNEKALYACLSMDDGDVPEQIRKHSIVVRGDCAQAIRELAS